MVHFYYRIFLFFLGLTLGILIKKSHIYVQKSETIQPYDAWFKNQGLHRKSVSWDNLRYMKPLNRSVIESDFLFKKITILCVILMKNAKYSESIKATWAKGCNAIKFIDIGKRKTIPIKRDIRDSSWAKLCLYLTDVGNYDWLLITSDLSFVITENLRYFLAPFDPEYEHYLGYPVEFWKTVYNSVQSGIVLSKGTVKAFKTSISTKDCLNSSNWNREDYYLGKTLAGLNITPVNTLDQNGFSVFYPGNLNSLIFHEGSDYKLSVFPIKCCSKHTVSFQAIDGDKMYTYYYLLYTLQLFTEGRIGNRPRLQEKDDEVWKTFLKQRNVTKDYVSSSEYYRLWEDLIDDPTSFASKMKREMIDDL